MPMGTLAADKRREAPSARGDRKAQIPPAIATPDAQRSVRTPPANPHASAGAPAHAVAAASAVAAAAAVPADLPVAKSRLTLERVIGITSLSNAMVAVNPVTGEIAYAAGCIVVIYNLRRNKQVRYYRVEKSVACLCFSPSGQYLAIGEKGYLPSITIWDGTDGTLCAELQLHKFGVACVAFSRDGRYLLSAGLVHDQHLYAWDLHKETSDGAMRGVAVGAAALHEKVLAMDYCQDGNFFVTVGEKHFKFWFLDDHDEFLLTGYEINGVAEIQHRDAVMAAKSDATFTGVACGYGTCRLKTFAVTSDGTLCCFGASCIMERLVSLEATHGNAISVTEAYVAVAGSSSIVRLFDPATLEYRATMPFPPPFGAANAPHDASSNLLHPDVPHRYPAVLAVRVTGAHVIVLYSDRSWFVYDVSDTQNARVERSFLSHSGSIRDLAIAGRVRGLTAKGKLVYAVDDNRRLGSAAVVPNGTFVTCSDDNTLRLWHMDLHKQMKSSRFNSHDGGDSAASADSHAWRNPFSLEMLGVVYHDSEADFASEDSTVLGGTCSSDEVTDIHAPSSEHGPVNGLRAVAIHPSQTQVVAGDKDGNVVVLELPGLASVREVDAHNTEVHCLAFSDSSGDDSLSSGEHRRRCLLASGGRDRLVHVYDCSKAHAVVATLDNHSGAVTSLAFTRDGTKLLSCGADKTIVFSHVHADGSVVRYNSVPCSGGKVFDMALTTDSERVLTSCNNRLEVHSVATGKLVASHHVGEQHRIAVCPANYCVAMSGSLADKTIHVVDLATGETLADATGHGEAITAVAFTPDCRRLVSTSSDGCLFVWRLSDEIQSAMKARLPRVTEAHAPMPVPPSIARAPATPSSPVVHDIVVMPPPAPPIAAPKTLRAPAVHAHGAKARTPTATATSSGVDHQSSSNRHALPSSGRRKSGSHADGSAIAAALAMPKKSSDAKDVRGWKGRGAPAPPGPMAKIPMEDWMRTRESAKRTVHVADDDDSDDRTESHAVGAPTAALAIDRSQTPDWAKTVKLAETAKRSVRKSPVHREPLRHAGEKWGKRAAVPQPRVARESLDDTTALDRTTAAGSRDVSDGDRDDDDDDRGDSEKDESESPLFIKQQSGELHQLDVPQSKEVAARPEIQRSHRDQQPTAAAEADLLTLSVEHVDVKALGASASLPSGSSLALEREQLEKRKKQIETANAVAAMNTRLLQLGLLKPHARAAQDAAVNDRESGGERPRDAADDLGDANTATESLAEGRGALEQSPRLGATAADSIASAPELDRSDIPEEMLESIDVSTLEQVERDSDSARRTSERAEPSVEASLSAFTTGFQLARGVDALDASVAIASAAVSASMSAFTAGYSGSDCGRLGVSVGESVALPAVTASLSAFTAGYNTADDAQRASVAASVRVDESLSAFTSGFRAASDANGNESSSRASVDLAPGVGASMSTFTAGYTTSNSSSRGAVNESIALPAVSASLSSFTAGYNTVGDAAAPSSALVRESVNGVSASLSVFTSGYEQSPASAEALASSSADGLQSHVGGVNESLSVFTAGYEVASSSSRTPPVRYQDHSSGIGNNGSDVPVDQSLSAFTVGYETADVSRERHRVTASPTSATGAAPVSAATSARKEASQARAGAFASESGSPEATVLSTISDLDQQLVTVAKTFDDLLPTAKSAAPEVQEIQHLVTQLRAAIERYSSTET